MTNEELFIILFFLAIFTYRLDDFVTVCFYVCLIYLILRGIVFYWDLPKPAELTEEEKRIEKQENKELYYALKVSGLALLLGSLMIVAEIWDFYSLPVCLISILILFGYLIFSKDPSQSTSSQTPSIL